MAGSTVIRNRLRRAYRTLAADKSSSALLVSSNGAPIRSRDTRYPLRPNSDLFYLTGATVPDLALFLTSKSATPRLITPKPDAHKILWEGETTTYRDIAQAIGAELIVAENPRREILERLRGVETLYHQNMPDTLSWEVAKSLIERPSHQRGSLPKRFAHSDAIIEPMRLYKEPSEVALIRAAAVITNEALYSALPFCSPGTDEAWVAHTLNYFFRQAGADLAFNTIVASGRSAATLHYESYQRKLRRGEMLLIDCGAEYSLYAADITRMLPIGGKFIGAQADLYDIVLAAQKASLAAVRHGVKIQKVYNAAAKVMTAGLRELKVLKGDKSALMKKGAFKPHFPHGIGHPVGLDVHDVGDLRGNNGATLEKGMVFTIEPGLYFPKPTKYLPRCGVRIEDTVLVTQKGCEILTEGFPKERKEVEELLESEIEP